MSRRRILSNDFHSARNDSKTEAVQNTEVIPHARIEAGSFQIKNGPVVIRGARNRWVVSAIASAVLAMLGAGIHRFAQVQPLLFADGACVSTRLSPTRVHYKFRASSSLDCQDRAVGRVIRTPNICEWALAIHTTAASSVLCGSCVFLNAFALEWSSVIHSRPNEGGCRTEPWRAPRFGLWLGTASLAPANRCLESRMRIHSLLVGKAPDHSQKDSESSYGSSWLTHGSGRGPDPSDPGQKPQGVLCGGVRVRVRLLSRADRPEGR